MSKKQNTVYKKMIEAHIIIFALLVYFYTFNGSMKLLIDRTFTIEKTDVIEKCNHLAVKYGYEKLHFYQGDIADYEGVSSVDMVVTLHACDTATDYALAKAVEWGAKVILSVPCCQHEVNRQIKNEVLEPVLKYGILKERMAALMTDGIRANLLESMGYETQILEFIDMEHTPKNLLIRAVKTGKPKDMKSTVQLMKELHINPTLERLLHREGEVQSES